jgi:beta-aspartyl-peptidase (threonine type)
MLSGREKGVELVHPVLVVHGGAWYITEEEQTAAITGCREAVEAGWTSLVRGASAVDVVETSVRILEDDPTFDAGRGSYFNRVGDVQMDAILMDGRTLEFGAIAAVRNVAHPITLARYVMERCEHRLIVGEGAEALAESYDMDPVSKDIQWGREDPGGWLPPKHTLPSTVRFGDTVGAIAIDSDGNVAVATSTGGTPNKWPGRVGDSPLIGCGAYADNLVGAAAATGSGEDLMRIVTSKTACDLMAGGLTAQEAADVVIAKLWERVRGYGGVILVDRQGGIGLAHNTPNLAYAYRSFASDIVVGVEIE